MQILVDLHLFVFGLFSAFAVACLAVHIALKAGSAPAWLAATLAVVAAETLVFRYTAQSRLGLAAIGLLLPSAYLFAGNAIRQSLQLEIANWRQVRIFAGLIGASMLLIAAEAPVFYQIIPFQLAGVYIFFETIRIQMRRPSRSMIDNALLLLCFCSMLGLAIRAPMFPLLLGQPTPFQIMEADLFNGVFINALSFLTLGLAILLIAKIVTNVIALHKSQADHDELTGLLNRRSFDGVVKRADGAAGSVVMCDIDHFKSVNDTCGHHAGDDVIRTFASILSRSGGCAGRMGGEEFALLLLDASLEDAVRVAEHIRLEFHDCRHPLVGKETALSASFGVAGFTGKSSIEDALRRADKALYCAKAMGRNRVCRDAPVPSLRPTLEIVAQGQGPGSIQPASGTAISSAADGGLSAIGSPDR